MFRVVLTYQLVLMLLAGPMLCCCTAAQLGRGRDTHTASHVPATKGVRKSCCGKQKPSDPRPPLPDQQPNHPAKCPCKDGSTKLVAVPATPTPSGDVFTLFVSDLVPLDQPVTINGAGSAVQVVRRSERNGFGLSTADLLYAHHKLRC